MQYPYYYYLAHGGPGSGRYPAGSGERPWQHRSGMRIQRRSLKKLTKFERKAQRVQADIDKRFNKYERKNMSRWSSEKGIAKAKGKVVQSQRALNRIEVKGSRYYQRALKKLERRDMSMETEAARIGEEFLRRTREKSRFMYLSISAA